MDYLMLEDYRVELNYDVTADVTHKVIVTVGSSQYQSDTRPELIEHLLLPENERGLRYTHIAGYKRLDIHSWFFAPKRRYVGI